MMALAAPSAPVIPRRATNVGRGAGMSDVQKWLLALGAAVASIAIAYAWLDRPIAFFAHAQLAQYRVFAVMTRLPEWVAPAAGIILLVLGVRALLHKVLGKPCAALLLCSASLIVAAAIKDQLKFAFGRTWPETWVQNNPSLIRDDVFGFNPFHGGIGYASFPSGHTTVTCAVVAVLWLMYPRLRLLYAACVLVVAVGLLGADYHFLSDVIAGAFLGISTGWMAVALWHNGAKR